MECDIKSVFLGGLIFLLGTSAAHAVLIDFDDAGLVHESDITTFYTGVTFRGIPNPFVAVGPFPAPATLPNETGTAIVWNPPSVGDAPGESPPNFAVGVLPTEDVPGDPGILISFDEDISSLSVTGLDYANVGVAGPDREEMTLSAYDAIGNLVGQEHFIDQFVAAAIRGTIELPNMRHVAFNYTSSAPLFYGIDDLEYTPVNGGPGPQPVPEPSTIVLFGLGLAGLGITRRRMKI